MALSPVFALATGSLIGGTACLAMAAVAWRRRTVTATVPFLGLLVAASSWSFANAVLLLAPGPEVAYVADRVIRAAAAHVAPLWFVFAIWFTGHGEWLTPRNLSLLWIYPIAYIVASLTAPFHGLASTTDEVVRVTTNGMTVYVVPEGVVFQLHVVFAALTFLAAIGILLAFFVRSRAVYRKQLLVILGSVAVPFLLEGVANFGLLPHPGIDPTPIALVCSMFLLGWGVIRYDFLTVTPLAGDVLIDELPDPVFVLDNRDVVVDHNPAAAAAFGVDHPGGKPIESLAPGLLDHLESGTTYGTVDADRADAVGQRFFDPKVTALQDQHGNERNTLVVLRDVTGQRRRQQRLEALQEATRRFLTASTDEEIAGIGVEYADEVLDTHGTAVFLADGGDELAPAAMSDAMDDVFDRGVPPDQPVAGTLEGAYAEGERTSRELPGEVGGAAERSLAVPLGDHGVFWIATDATDVFAPDDEGFATILARTTQVALSRIERESELRESRSSVERRSEQIAFFSGVLRHTLRNALLVIQGRAEHLREAVPDDEEAHVDTVVNWCEDLASLSEEIRAVNDTATATESERLDTVDLSALLSTRAQRFADEYDATFETDVESGLCVQANELAGRVVESVLENAVIHNDRAEPHVTIRTVRAADRVQVHVADDGPGIDDDLKSTVFERDLSTNQTASGFGLYFVSVLMNLYGGTVRFEDNDPRGTVAVLEFQAAASPADEGGAVDAETD